MSGRPRLRTVLRGSAAIIGVGVLSACFGPEPVPVSQARTAFADDQIAAAGAMAEKGAYRDALFALEAAEAAIGATDRVRALRRDIEGKRRAAAQRYREAGQAALQAGQDRQAHKAFARALVLDPSDRESRAALVRLEGERARDVQARVLEMRRANRAKAAAASEPDDEDPPEHADHQYTNAIRLYRDGAYEASYRAFTLMAQGPDAEKARRYALASALNLAHEAHESGAGEGAAKWYRRALAFEGVSITNEPDIPENWLAQASGAVHDEVNGHLAEATRLMNRDLTQAIALLKEALALDPKNAQAKRLLKRAQTMQRNLDRLRKSDS